MFGLAGYQDVLTEQKPGRLNREYITKNMDNIYLQFWINAKVADGYPLFRLIKKINSIRKDKGWGPVFLTKVGYDSIQSANTDTPSLNYTTNKKRSININEDIEYNKRKYARKALRDLQNMNDSVDIGLFDRRYWGNTGLGNTVGPFEKYLRSELHKSTKRSRSSKSSISEQSSDFSSENSANSSSSRKTKKARK